MIGCGAVLVWPLVSAAVVIPLFVWSRPESNVWVLAVVILAALWFPQIYWSDELWAIADGLAARLDRSRTNIWLLAVQRVLVNAESLRVTVIPLLIGAWVAAFPGENPTLGAVFMLAAAATLAGIYWLQIDSERQRLRGRETR
jgi:hypothetical protein